MLEWQALLKKVGAINFRAGSARRAEKMQSFPAASKTVL
jgi:hypothetical protein